LSLDVVESLLAANVDEGVAWVVVPLGLVARYAEVVVDCGELGVVAAVFVEPSC
jgi:hypothetical protein